MRAVVVYESMFGNTRTIADAIAAGLASTYEVQVIPVGAVTEDQLDGVDLLLVGGPTHVWGMSRPNTRKGAATQAGAAGSTVTLEPDATGGGLREWFAAMTSGPRNAAAFDTRVDKPALVTGRASTKVARALRRLGCRLVASPESFLVTSHSPTTLVAGEEARARAWGEQLASISVNSTTA